MLHVAGVPGFPGNLDEVMEASDSEGGAWRAFIQLWWDRFGSAEVSVSYLIGVAGHPEASLPISAKNDQGLKVALGAAFTKLRDRAFRTSDRLAHPPSRPEQAGRERLLHLLPRGGMKQHSHSGMNDCQAQGSSRSLALYCLGRLKQREASVTQDGD